MKIIKSHKHLINKEISWLYFNHRVLQEAQDPTVPLLERLRFLGIYSNNLDEFFRVRVATLKRLSEMDDKLFPAYEKPAHILKKVSTMTSEFQLEFEATYKKIVEELKTEHIYLVNEKELNEKDKEFVKQFYKKELADNLYPLMISKTEIFPELRDARIYLAIKLFNTENLNKKEYALIEIPTKFMSRFIVLPTKGEDTRIILLDDVIRFCLPKIFKSLDYDGFEAYTFKITRDAEMEYEYDFGDSLLEKVIKGLKTRKSGSPVRFVYDSKMATDLNRFLLKKLNYKKTDTIIAGGKYHNFKDFVKFPTVGRKELVFEPFLSMQKARIEEASSVIMSCQTQDRFLHYPYFSFSQYLQLLQEAAIDPNVKSIKITLYRIAEYSKVTNTLINAARNGKAVTAVIELRARFDEEHNIEWANRLKEAGVKVLFGVEGLKIHSKLTLIKMKKGKTLACISTGNFHEGNASVYTDFTLMTTDRKITNEVEQVFEFIRMPFQNLNLNHLLVSPQEMRKKLNTLIQTEINNAKKGLPAYIHCKINHITDPKIIHKLYEAAELGVEVKLIVRGMCALTHPKETKDGLEVISIVDRYLEHSRIFIFCNKGDEKYYISSADWMPRNLDHRIEVAVPIYDKSVQEELKRIVDYALKDNVKARIVDGTGKNKFKCNNEEPFRSQFELYKTYKKANEL